MRTFSATPEVCPRSTTIARRRLLAGAATIAFTAPAVALAMPAAPHPDAGLIAKTLRFVEIDASEFPDDDAAAEALCDELNALDGVLISAPATTMTGMVAKLAHVAMKLDDGFVHDLGEDDELVPLLATIRAALPTIDPTTGRMLAYITDKLESIARAAARSNHSTAEYFSKSPHEWKYIDDLFERHGVNTRLEENRRKNLETDTMERGTKLIAGAMSSMKPDDFRDYTDYIFIQQVHYKTQVALENMAECDHPGTRMLIRRIADHFTGLAERFPTTV